VAFRVALTFDAEHPDRPGGTSGSAVVDVLERAGVPATFFLQGRWVEADPDLARRIRDAGHLIGSHSHYHARMNLLSRTGFRTDVRAAEAVINRILGTDPRPWFRMPFGVGADRTELIDELRELGYRHVGWTVEPREWRIGVSAAAVVREVVADTQRQGDGAIVLMHTWPKTMTGALPAIVDALRAHGARLVRVDDLPLPAGLAPIAEPRPPDEARRSA
jgi:peptidoglycan/xylan/chitin deacetylase (PgdA/CDA1 family)